MTRDLIKKILLTGSIGALLLSGLSTYAKAEVPQSVYEFPKSTFVSAF
jgi:hypothetical protein